MQLYMFADTREYLNSLQDSARSQVMEDMHLLAVTDDRAVRTKQLKGQIRELIVGDHRLTYFKIFDTLYFVRGFRKQSRKTPPAEIEYAENVYKMVKQTV